jgi:hypothetical protein
VQLLHTFSISVLDGVGRQLHNPAAITPGIETPVPTRLEAAKDKETSLSRDKNRTSHPDCRPLTNIILDSRNITCRIFEKSH